MQMKLSSSRKVFDPKTKDVVPKIVLGQNSKQKMSLISEFKQIFCEIDIEKTGHTPILLNSIQIHKEVEFYFESCWKNFFKLIAEDELSVPKLMKQLINANSKVNLKSVIDLVYSVAER